MPIQIQIIAGKEYEGPHRFAKLGTDGKSEPKLTEITPKLAIETAILPPTLQGFLAPEKIILPGTDVIELSELARARAGFSAPFAIEAKLKVLDSGIAVMQPDQSSYRALELGDLGKLNKNLNWEFRAFVFDQERRHRCQVIISEDRNVSGFDAVKFVKDHYHPNPVPRPLKP